MARMKTEKDVLVAVQNDAIMMDILKTVQELDLPDWWVCAGFVRSKIWDVLHNFPQQTALPDVDVIYFDPDRVDEQYEKELEKQLERKMPQLPWSVKNQARMHHLNNVAPYTSSVDGISKFPETATALGVKLDKEDKLILTAPHGLEDVLQMVVKPSPGFEEEPLASIYRKRVKQKNWHSIWHKVTVVNPDKEEGSHAKSGSGKVR
ncbi:nucleotidyltransferase family protein [Thalassobacillus hwangdonensis]|uniref:Nucleotidyltransferase family protein n=1 Tax=Thalassobacillus hwangdonensis TaxID=546108 RepID=A0ABW3L7B4_9BACI